MMEKQILAQILRNQYRFADVLTQLLMAPGVTAYPRPGVSLYKLLDYVQAETFTVLERAELKVEL